MTRDELDQLMLLYAAGVADEHETAQAEAALGSNDSSAQMSYAEALAVVHSMALALPQQSPPKRVRDQLMKTVLLSSQVPANKTVQSSTRNITWATWIMGGVAAVLALGVVWVWTDRQRVSNQLAVSTQNEQVTNRIAASPHVRLTKLHLGETQIDQDGTPNGRIIYCPVSNQYQLRVFRMAAPPPGREYELWLITPDGKSMPAGTFTVDELGSATHYFRAPKGDAFQIAAVTTEPAGGSRSPTSAIVLQGKLNIQQ